MDKDTDGTVARNLKFYCAKILLKAYEYILITRNWWLCMWRGENDASLLAQASQTARLNKSPISSPGLAKVHIVIPLRDGWEMTHNLLSTLKDICRYQVTITLVNNRSEAPETLAGLKAFSSSENHHVIDANFNFNFSKIINLGVQHQLTSLAEDDLICILNNDIEFASVSDIEKLFDSFYQYKAGVMGCTLRYPDHSIQHLYAQPGVKIVASHPFKKQQFDPSHPWFQGAVKVPAVTGAVMLFTRKCFEDLEGLDENLPTVGQDVDFCMRADLKGYAVMVDASVCAIHHEGKTRGKSLQYDEVRYIYDKWGHQLETYPLLVPQQTRWSEKVIFSLGEGRYPWWLFV